MSHKTKQMKRRKGSSGTRVLAATAETYTGPVVGRNANQSTAPVEVVIAQGYSPSISGSAAYYYLFAHAASATQSTSIVDTAQWQAMKEIYDEFRVLGIEVEAAPATFVVLGGASWSLPPAAWMFAKREPTDAPDISLTFGEASAYDGFRFMNVVSSTKMSVKMNGTPEANWLSTDIANNVPTDYTGIGIGTTTGNAVTFNVKVSWRVQFRSSKATTALLRLKHAKLPKNAQTSSEADADDEEELALAASDESELVHSLVRRVRTALSVKGG